MCEAPFCRGSNGVANSWFSRQILIGLSAKKPLRKHIPAYALFFVFLFSLQNQVFAQEECREIQGNFYFESKVGNYLPADFPSVFAQNCAEKGGTLRRYCTWIDCTMHCDEPSEKLEFSWHPDDNYYWFDMSACGSNYTFPEHPITSPKPSVCEANPCNPLTGDKIETETDYRSHTGDLVFLRTYHSGLSPQTSGGMPPGWRHNYQAGVNRAAHQQTINQKTSDTPGYPNPDWACRDGWEWIKAKVMGGAYSSATAQYEGGHLCSLYLDGKRLSTFLINSRAPLGVSIPSNYKVISYANGETGLFVLDDETWASSTSSDQSLTSQDGSWVLTIGNGRWEIFSSDGKLEKRISKEGRETLLVYDIIAADGGDDDPETLDKVIAPSGRTLQFSYDTNGRLQHLTTPDGIIRYHYTEDGNLGNVEYPDGSTRTYHYENTSFPNHLTGITDENGNRYATWAYDGQGRAILSEHAGETDRVTFTYNSNGTTTVQTAQGATRTYHFNLINGALKVTSITGDQCTSCYGGDIKNREYDANGYLISATDWKGNITVYIRDEKGRELSRTEAADTPEERTITTEWHPNYRLPIRITESHKITEYSYSPQGQLLNSTERTP